MTERESLTPPPLLKSAHFLLTRVDRQSCYVAVAVLVLSQAFGEVQASKRKPTNQMREGALGREREATGDGRRHI